MFLLSVLSLLNTFEFEFVWDYAMVIENSEKKFTAIYLTCLGVPEHTSTCGG